MDEGVEDNGLRPKMQRDVNTDVKEGEAPPEESLEVCSCSLL